MPLALSAGDVAYWALAIFLVLWCLIGRGIAIEFRSHVAEPLWRGFWDVVFTGSSALLPVPGTGLVAVGSSDPNRFFPGMGTLFLRMMGEALATALQRFDR